MTSSVFNKNFSRNWQKVYFVYFMICYSVFVLLLVFTTIVSGSGHETTKQEVTRYNNYKTICTGLGYQNLQCKAGNDGGKSKTSFIVYMYIIKCFFFLLDKVFARESYLLFQHLLFVGIVFQSSLTKTLQNLRKQETVIYGQGLAKWRKSLWWKTGKFTATVERVYVFSWTTLSYPGKYFVSEIVYNGNAIAYSQCNEKGLSGHPSSSNQVNIKLKKGDKVWIRAQGNYGQYAYGGNLCSFLDIRSDDVMRIMILEIFIWELWLLNAAAFWHLEISNKLNVQSVFAFSFFFFF